MDSPSTASIAPLEIFSRRGNRRKKKYAAASTSAAVPQKMYGAAP